MSGGQDQLTIILLAFAVVAIIVTALVISNTFSVLVVQRTRELGAAALRTTVTHGLRGHACAEPPGGSQYPADSTAAALETLASMEGVEAAAALTAVATTSVESGERTVYAIPGSDAEAVLRSALTRPVDDIVLMPEDSGLEEIAIDGAAGGETLPVGESRAGPWFRLSTSEETAERLGIVTGPASQGSEVWLKLDDSLGSGAVTALQTEIVETLGLSDYQVSGNAQRSTRLSPVEGLAMG